MDNNMPMVDFFGNRVSRLILGSNPLNGNSHRGPEDDRAMDEWYTFERIKADFLRALSCGINTTQLTGNMIFWKMMRELRNEGHPIQWIANTSPAMASFDGMLRQVCASQPIAIYQHGSEADSLFAAGKTEELLTHLKKIRDTGLPVGLGSHNPRLIEYAEEHDWDVDFYMTCCYNVMKHQLRLSSSVTGISNNGEAFDEEDVPVMLDVVRKVNKPCLVFKLLGAGRVCTSDEAIEERFRYVLGSIKPTDCVVVGSWQKDRDEIAMNASLVKRYGQLG